MLLMKVIVSAQSCDQPLYKRLDLASSSPNALYPIIGIVLLLTTEHVSADKSSNTDIGALPGK